MSLERFNKIFKIDTNLIDEQKKFITRINATIFNPFVVNHSLDREYIIIAEILCYKLGINSTVLIEEIHGKKYGKNFNEYSKVDFHKTLLILVLLIEIVSDKKIIRNRTIADRWLKNFKKAIEMALNEAMPILNINFHNDMFYPAGDSTLDYNVIQDAYDKLIPYDNEKMDLKNAMENLMSGDLYGVVGKCYIALEGISKVFLKNSKTLSNNDKALITKLNFPSGFRTMFNGYMTYAQEYHRHAGENRHKLNFEDVETFLYLTCVFIRLIVIKMEATTKLN